MSLQQHDCVLMYKSFIMLEARRFVLAEVAEEVVRKNQLIIRLTSHGRTNTMDDDFGAVYGSHRRSTRVRCRVAA